MHKPEWADKAASKFCIEFMRQVLTKDGARVSNGVVVGSGFLLNNLRDSPNYLPLFIIITDVGNLLRLSMNEFDDLYKLGDWVMKEFPTQEAKECFLRYYKEFYRLEDKDI